MAGAAHHGGGIDPDWANVGWLGKLALIFAGTFIGIGLFAIGPALPVLQTHFASEAHASLLVQLIGGISPPVFALFSPVAGKLVSRFGVRTVYLVSLAIFLIGGLGPSICTSLIQMLVFRFVLGVGVAGAFTAAMSGIARVPESQRHLLYGFAAFVGGAICIPAFPIVGALAKDSWRMAFLAPLMLVPTGLFALGLPRHRAAPAAATQAVRRASGPLGGVPAPLLILCLIDGWAMIGTSLYAPFLLASVGTTDPTMVGKMLGITALCSLAGSGCYGFAQKLLGTRGMVITAPAVAAVGCMIVYLSDALPMAVAGLGLMSAAMGVFGAAGYAAAVEAAGPEGDSGAATGMVSLAVYFPQLVFPMIAAAIGTRFGPPAVYLLLAVLLVIGLVLVAIRRARRREAAGHPVGAA